VGFLGLGKEGSSGAARGEATWEVEERGDDPGGGDHADMISRPALGGEGQIPASYTYAVQWH
jgi:hypothetical protein